MHQQIREPKQKRSIEKKEKIIDAGWKLISKNGYYNTNTFEIAKEAGVSTGIVYQYFQDKHDILIAGMEKYADDIFYPMIQLENIEITKENIPTIIEDIIEKYIKDHTLSKKTHEEIIAMSHMDEEIAEYFYKREMKLTNGLYELFKQANIKEDDLLEKIHIMIGMIDNFCHEIVYHKHNSLDYQKMKKILLIAIEHILTK